MCLVVFRHTPEADCRLVLVGNRDEWHRRPTQALQWWQDVPILGGRDVTGGGTWLAVDASGRFAVLTNVQGMEAPTGAPTRGELIPAFLRQREAPASFLGNLQPRAHRYAGFNLVVGDLTGAYALSNAPPSHLHRLDNGSFAVGNDPIGTPAPKCEAGLRGLECAIEEGLQARNLRGALASRQPTQMAATQVVGSLADDPRLSAPFVIHPDYGTRSTTVLVLNKSGGWIEESRFDATGALSGRTRVVLTDRPFHR